MSEPVSTLGAVIALGVIFGPTVLLGCAMLHVASRPRKTFRQCIEDGAERAIREFRPTLARMVDEEAAKRPDFMFVKHMQARLHEACPAMSGSESWQRAAGAYRQFLRDERTKFGDPRFSWDRAGARELAEAYEIECW